MGKVFLSHSSVDKKFIIEVANLIGHDKCIVDKYEFEAGIKNVDEIFNALEKTDIFVFFISNSSLNSDWVKLELSSAKEKLGVNSSKLERIFPIIIDTNVKYDDERIPIYLRKGFDSYNLRHILDPKIVYRKIQAQLVKNLMDNNITYKRKNTFFYGRDLEKSSFKSRLDDVLKGPLKCMVISGVDGIGRKSFIRAALEDAQLIEVYYFPMIISLKRTEGIEDLIVKLSDLGLSNLRLEDVTAIKNMDDKINLLADLLKAAQEYKEHIIIEDNMCLISINGHLIYWFEKAVEKIAPKLSVSVVSSVRLDDFRCRKNNWIFYIPISELSRTESAGLLRSFSKLEGIEFEREDIEFMQECLSGYPPQIMYCIEMAKKEGINYVKNNSYMVEQMPEQISSKILLYAIDKGNEEKYKSLLALLADFENTPISLLNDIIKLNDIYKEALHKFKALSICYEIGSTRDYLKINTFLQNFIKRNKYVINDDIKEILTKNLENFQSRCNDNTYTDTLDLAELSYYIKANLKDNKYVPEKFMYSTVLLESIIELYDRKQYIKVINIVKEMDLNNRIDTYDDEVKIRFKYYYCLALARKKSIEFDSQVEFFKANDRKISYYFLKGFNYRINGEFEKAEKCYNEVITLNRNHIQSRRELVSIYVSTQEYDMAYDLAKINFYKDKNNLISQQAYLECLIFRKSRTIQDNQDIEEIVDLVKKMYKSIHNNGIYYQILAKYEAFINNNKEKAIKYIEEGMSENKNSIQSYLLRDLFDIYEKYGDINGMESTYENLIREMERIDLDDGRLQNLVVGKKALLEAHKGNSKMAINYQVQQNNKISKRSKDNILKNVERILSYN